LVADNGDAARSAAAGSKENQQKRANFLKIYCKNMSTLSFSSEKRKDFSSFFLFLGFCRQEIRKVARIDNQVVDSGAKWVKTGYVYR